MNTSERINNVIEYVENHITEKLDLNYLASLACCSVVNFQQMFMSITEMSLADYVRKRRLTLAGIELQRNGIKVIDAAIKYGYNSPVSFARAFQAFHGITPSEAKNPDIMLKEFSRLTLQIFFKPMSGVKVIERGEIILCGLFANNDDFGAIWDKWARMTEVHEIHHGVIPPDRNGIAHEVRFYPADNKFNFVGGEVFRCEPDSAYDYLTLPPSIYAIFDIDHKLDQWPQYENVNKWLYDNKNTYTRAVWDAGGFISASDFAIYRYDHHEKFKRDRIMEMWIPLVKI